MENMYLNEAGRLVEINIHTKKCQLYHHQPITMGKDLLFIEQ